MSGNLIIIAAPSGAGKSSLVAALLEADARVRLSVSYTTRPPRPAEVEGRDYHFVSRPEFERMIAAGDFLEHAEVYGNLYGTSAAWVRAALADGADIALEIDWQGAAQVRRLFPDAIGIYILPPSLAALEQRLRARGQDSDQIVARRLASARADMSHVIEFDYVIINSVFGDAAADLAAIARAARLTRRAQQLANGALLKDLCSGTARARITAENCL